MSQLSLVKKILAYVGVTVVIVMVTYACHTPTQPEKSNVIRLPEQRQPVQGAEQLHGMSVQGGGSNARGVGQVETETPIEPKAEISSRSSKIMVENERVYLPVKVQVGSTSVECVMLLSTGVSHVIVDLKMAQKLNLKNIQDISFTYDSGRTVQAQAATVDKVVAGGASVDNVLIGLLDTESNDKYQGVLGMNFLKHFDYKIDLKNGFIYWR